MKVEEKSVEEEESYLSNWGKVSAVLFDMDGVLCNSEEPSRKAGVDVFAEMGVEVTVEDFVPFMGTGNEYEVFYNSCSLASSLYIVSYARICKQYCREFGL